MAATPVLWLFCSCGHSESRHLLNRLSLCCGFAENIYTLLFDLSDSQKILHKNRNSQSLPSGFQSKNI